MIYVNGTCADPRGVELVSNLSLRTELGAEGVIPNLTDAGFIGKFMGDSLYRACCYQRIAEAIELGATAIALGAHQLCHRNPVTDAQQISQVIDALELVHEKFPDLERYVGTFLLHLESGAEVPTSAGLVLPWRQMYVYDSAAQLPIYEASE